MLDLTVICSKQIVREVSDCLGSFFKENSGEISSVRAISHDANFGGIAIVKYDDPKITREPNGNLPISQEGQVLIGRLVSRLVFMECVNGVINDALNEFPMPT